MIASRTRSTLRASARALLRIVALLLPLTVLAASGDAPRLSGQRSAAALVTDWNTTFVNNAGPSGTVGAFAVWDDGSGEALYAGGHNNSTSAGFTTAGGIATQWIGRWNGNSWSALGTGLNGPVFDMVAFGDELVVSGSFTVAGGVPVDGFARWNGQRWAGFDGEIESVSALVVFGGELVVAGGVRQADGTLESRIAKLSNNEWVLLGPGFGSITSVLIDYNGVLVAGGNFRTIGGNPIKNVAQWTGTEWQPIGAGLSNWVMQLAVHEGDLIASGLFNLASSGSLPPSRVARWNGSTWSAVGVLSQAEALASHNGELLAATDRLSGGVVRFNGNAWVPLGGGTDALVYGLLSHQGQLYAGGTFARAGTAAANRVAQWNGSTWAALGSGMDGSPFDFVEFEGDLIAAGSFRSAGGVLTSRIARWNGDHWAALGAGLGSEGYAVAVYDNQLVAAGPNFVARWNGTSWNTLGTSTTGYVYDLIEFNGDLIAAGHFSEIEGVAVNNIARWTGSAWAPMGSTSLNDISSMIIFEQQLIIAGSLTSTAGVPDYNVARWDGQSWQPMGRGSNYWIYALAVHDGALVAGGRFDGIEATISPVIQWNGQSWDALSGLEHHVRDLTTYAGNLIAASSNGLLADMPVSRWNGTSWSRVGGAFELGVSSLQVFRGQLIAGGNFHRVGNMVSPFIAAYGPAQSTSVTIISTSPSPSQPGQPVQISVQVTGVTAPTVGHVTITGSPGGSCTDLVLDPLDATTSVAQCTIQWNTACPRRVLANYIGGTDGLTTWQSSVSASATHVVAGGVGCALPDLFGDGFE